jgi:hypothetical protein
MKADGGKPMKLSILRILAIVAVAALLVPAALADTLELKDGKVIQGKYLGGTQTNIRFSVKGEVKLYPISDVLAITFGSAGSDSPAAAAPPPPPAPTSRATSRSASGTQSATIPAGTRLLVRMIDGVDSETNQVGDRFRASLEEDVVVDGVVVAPRGADVAGRLAEVKEAGRIRGKSELKLELTEIIVNGQTYNITSGEYEVSGKSRGGDTGKKVAIGAAVGAAVGAIAGGGKGAAIGAGVGAGAGTAIQIFTKGEQVKVPSETMLEFALEQALTVRVPRTTAR